MSCILVFMHGCIWVYMCMHHGVGGVHVRTYLCVYECLQSQFFFSCGNFFQAVKL